MSDEKSFQYVKIMLPLFRAVVNFPFTIIGVDIKLIPHPNVCWGVGTGYKARILGILEGKCRRRNELTKVGTAKTNCVVVVLLMHIGVGGRIAGRAAAPPPSTVG